MPSHISESDLYGAAYSTPEFIAVFNDHNRVQKWFDVEAALAEAQAELGMIPSSAAEEICRKARVENVDIVAIGHQISATAHPIVPAVRALQSICEASAGEFVHYGATTQDIVDTGMVLQVKQAWPLVLRDLNASRQALVNLARTHRDTPMAGRTHGQQALPITFGYKCAVWIDEITRQLQRCSEAEARLFTGNLTGAVGTMASFGRQGRQMQTLALDKLGLAAPIICWHSARDRVIELANLISQIGGTFGKIAREIYALQQVEFGEVAEPHPLGKVGSSTMPHKRNPAMVELVIGLSRLIRAQQVALSDAAFQEHERYSALLRIELAAIPEIMIYCGALLARMRTVLEQLVVDPERMWANLNLLGGLLLSERVMLALGQSIGKQSAHEVIQEIATQAFENKQPFRDVLLADVRVTVHLDAAAIDQLLDPTGYIGEALELVDDVLNQLPDIDTNAG